MKITRLSISSLLGIRDLDLRPSRPVAIITASNGQGKTSIVNALSLAMEYRLPRIDKQKDADAILNDGAKHGTVEVWTDSYKDPFGAFVAPGKVSWKNPAGEEGPSFIEYVLNPALFASQPVAERRSMLYRLLGLDLSADGIKARLIEKECDAKKVEDMAPMLRAGFEAAQKHAASQATMAKGAFKATTAGETWGAQKGATYRAPTPSFSGEEAAELHGIDQSIKDAEADRADATKRLGIAEHEATQAKKRADTIEHLRAKAKTHAEHSSLVNAAAKELERLKADLLDAQQKAGQKPKDWHSKLTCPHCQGALMDSDDGESLVPWQDPPAVTYDAEAAARIPDLQKAIITQQRVHERHQGNEREADEAGQELRKLEDATEPAKKPEDPAIVRQTVETLQATIATKRKRQAELQDAQRKLDEADAKTKQARAHHADVLAWDTISKALAPDGIPAEILNEALGPVNDRLAVSCGDTQWPLVALAEDMSISYGERPYALCSESEQWRVNALLAESISYLSGLKMFVLDRADLLDADGWAQLLKWIDTLAYEKDVDTLLVLATTDYEPSDLTDLMQSVRIEAGAIVRPEQREAA